MNCKHCQQELEEGITLCPNCGTENAEIPGDTVQEAAVSEAEETVPETEAASVAETETPTTQENVKLTPGKLALAITACVVLLAVLIALIVGGTTPADSTGETEDPYATTESTATDATEETVPPTCPPDGNPEDVTAQGSYDPEDFEVLENMDTAIATVGGHTLTNLDLQVYYGMIINQFLNSNNFQYLYYYGIVDFTQPLDSMMCYLDSSLTWQQYFLSEALASWHCYQALACEAEAVGYEMEDEHREYLDNLPQTMEEDAAYYGYASVEEMLTASFGNGATMDAYLAFQEVYYLGYSYYLNQCSQIDPTDEEVEAYFTENETLFNENGVTRQSKVVDVRHILVKPEGGTTDANDNTTYSDAEWAACLAEAERIRDEWLSGDKTEESFAELATQYTEDPGSQGTGGLYTDVSEGEMTTTFNNWCFDTSRKVGDYGIVQTSYGYHIMYYSGETYTWMDTARETMIADLSNTVISELMEKYPIEADYLSMVIYFGNLV